MRYIIPDRGSTMQRVAAVSCTDAVVRKALRLGTVSEGLASYGGGDRQRDTLVVAPGIGGLALP